MQIYAKLNDNKSIQAYSTEQQDGYKQYTIDDANANFLAEYYGLMWADANGLIHAENLPVTEYQRQLAEQEARIKQESADISAKLDTMQGKIDQANDLSSTLDNKLQNVNSAIAQMGQAMVILQASAQQPSTTSTDATIAATKEG